MRQAFMLLGIMTFIVSVGAFIALSRKSVTPPTPLPETTSTPLSMSLLLTSPAFVEGGTIPSRFTCDGENVSPELHIANVPKGTAALVLVMDDPDIPGFVKEKFGIQKFDHWAVYNVPADTAVIPEGALVGTGALNTSGEAQYTGPCPPDREHRYIFRVYAVSSTLTFVKTPTLDEVETAAQGIMLESATLMGRYARINN